MAVAAMPMAIVSPFSDPMAVGACGPRTLSLSQADAELSVDASMLEQTRLTNRLAFPRIAISSYHAGGPDIIIRVLPIPTAAVYIECHSIFDQVM